jgi:hypothetical protein
VQILQQLEIPLDQRALGDDVHWIGIVPAHHQAAPRQLEARLDGLITVRVAAEHDQPALPARFLERLFQKLRRSGFDHQPPLEVRPAAEAEILM